MKFVKVFVGVALMLWCVSALAQDSLFAPAVNYNVGSHPWSVFASDLDGDGDNDLAVANEAQSNEGPDSISILMNNGSGSFVMEANYIVGNWPTSVFACDLDGDGDNDLAVANHHSYCLTILKNNGYGIFQVDSSPSVEYYAYSVVARDLDGDGDNDLAVTTAYSGVAILKNNGDGTFQGAVYYVVGGHHLISLSAYDLDYDGDIDLAVANSGSDNVSVLKNNGDGTFQAVVNYAVGVRPYWVAVSDFDNNGASDLAVVNNGSNNVSILFNNGDGTYQASVNYDVGEIPHSIFSCDLNEDGNNDLAIANSNSINVSILIGNGDGTFQAPVNYGVGIAPLSVFASDLNGDGRDDLATANWGSNDVSVLLNIGVYIGSICASVNLSDGSPAQGVIVKVINENNNPICTPIQTNEVGDAVFDSIEVGNYSVMIVTPLGYAVSPSETQTNIAVISGECTTVDFILTPTIIANNCRSIGYWKHQFDVYTSGRGHAQESASDLTAYLDIVHQHFDVLGIYVSLENYDFEDAKNVLTVRGGNLMLDRAKQQLFALLLNFASGSIGNETVISRDGRVAAEAVTLAANLLNDGIPANDEQAKTICDMINNGLMVSPGIIPQSPIRYKIGTAIGLPYMSSLSQNYPNPFNAQTTIRFDLPAAAHMTIEVYDILGRQVATLLDEDRPAGYHQVTWNAGNNPSGLYFYKIQAGEFTETKRMLMVK